MWLSEETRENLPIELNFKNEVNNCLKATENLKDIPWVKVGSFLILFDYVKISNFKLLGKLKKLKVTFFFNVFILNV